MHRLLIALKVFVVFALILGILYPGLITGISQIFMADKANGSLVIKNNVIVGSRLISQKFTQPQYFHSRPSAIDYDATNSGGSNLAPANPNLIAITKARIAQIRRENNLGSTAALPADMVLASGSGLDPHISLENVQLQLPRVAQTRHLAPEIINKLIAENTNLDFIGIWGKAGINVLQLNLALDELQKKSESKT